MGVGAGAVDVEDVGQAHLAGAEVEAALGDLGGERELGARRLSTSLSVRPMVWWSCTRAM